MLATSFTATAQVGIGTTTPHPGTVLDLSSSKPVLLPRISTTIMNAVSNPVVDMIAYNTTLGKFTGYAPSTSTSPIFGQTSGGTQQNLMVGNITTTSQTFNAPSDFLLASIFITAGSSGSVPVKMILQKGEGPGGDTLGIISKTISGNGANWFDFSFSSDITMVKDSVYTFTLEVLLPQRRQFMYGAPIMMLTLEVI
jgi:hypothetical protein